MYSGTKYPEIVSAQLTNGKLEIIKRFPSRVVLDTSPPQYPPDDLIKEIYAAVGDRIVLVEKVKGYVRPPSPESFCWDEQQ